MFSTLCKCRVIITISTSILRVVCKIKIVNVTNTMQTDKITEDLSITPIMTEQTIRYNEASGAMESTKTKYVKRYTPEMIATAIIFLSGRVTPTLAELK